MVNISSWSTPNRIGNLGEKAICPLLPAPAIQPQLPRPGCRKGLAPLIAELSPRVATFMYDQPVGCKPYFPALLSSAPADIGILTEEED